MKRSIALFFIIIALSGCSNTADIVKQETVEAAESVHTSAVVSEFTQTQATVIETEPEPEPKLFCDFEAECVTNSDYDEFIDAAEEYLIENEFQGAVLLAYNDEIILASGYGYADENTGRKCKAYDTFEIGSISKQMTAAAVLQLAEQGKLGLDDTIDEYFPDYKYGSMTTIRHLLQMRSGMVDFINNPALYFPEDYLEEYMAAADTGDDSEEVLEREFLLEYLNYPSLHNVPGDGFNYSNTNYYLLGLIMEQVTGESFQEYMSREIFGRCDMLTANNDFRNTTARGYYDDDTLQLLADGIDPICFPGLKTSISADDSKAINLDTTPKVILSASGMCEAGRIRHHLKHNLWRPESTILFVGYQSQGTLGRKLLDGADSVKLFGEAIQVRAHIAQMDGISGHGDQKIMLDWLGAMTKKPVKVFVNHGENEVTDEFARVIRERLGLDAEAPYNGGIFDLTAMTWLNPGFRTVLAKKKAYAAFNEHFQRLLRAGQHLLAVIEKNRGLANRELKKFADQVENLCNKWDR